MKIKRIEKTIPLERIYLHHENPRHEPYETQAQVIEWLCTNEEVPQLARDIANIGLSPLDRFGVTRDGDADGDDAIYIAAEGNRRLCALKLLTDPDLAPPERKAFFEKLANRWSPITEIPCVVFDDPDDLDTWLKRRHHGKMGGLGQKEWNSDQKARHSGSGSRNRVALAFLDYAEQENLISADERRRRLTTVQRFLSNPVMRETLGIETSDPDNITRNRTENDFRLLSNKFIHDMLTDNPRVNSRQNSAQITAYARELASLKGQTHDRVEAESILTPIEKFKKKRRSAPGKPKRPQKLPWRADIRDELAQLGSHKLTSLYHSICDVPLQEHTPLLTVGAWSFLETLTARIGRGDKVSFVDFLSKERIQQLGADSTPTKHLQEALRRISHSGNATKHDSVAGAFNGDQLANDIEVLGDLIRAIIREAVTRK